MSAESEVEQEMRSVPGFPGLFATDHGRVWRQKGDTLKPITPWVHEAGYYAVSAKGEDGKWAPRLVHRLVCLAFHGEPPGLGLVARHVNGQPLDNHPSNISWSTPAVNSQDMVRHGRSLKGTANKAAKLDYQKAFAIREAAAMGIARAALAERYGVSVWTIGVVVRKERWVEEPPQAALAA